MVKSQFAPYPFNIRYLHKIFQDKVCTFLSYLLLSLPKTFLKDFKSLFEVFLVVYIKKYKIIHCEAYEVPCEVFCGNIKH